jgi:putative transposase
MAADACRFSSLAVCLSAVSVLARRRNVGTSEQGSARARPQREGEKSHANCGYYRFSVSQDGTKRGQRGYDAGKKIKGRKRHIAVDTQGNLLAVVVHSAGIQDRVGARAVMMRLFRRFDSITTIFADGGYTGKLIDWAKEMFDYRVQVIKRNELHKFQVLPKRWIVERTFSWLNWSRRLSKDYEIRHTSAEAITYIAFTHQLLKRYV